MPDWNRSRFAKYRKTHPWRRLLEHARRRTRCKDPEGWWPLYGAKGIECHLTIEQVIAEVTQSYDVYFFHLIPQAWLTDFVGVIAAVNTAYVFLVQYLPNNTTPAA